MNCQRPERCQTSARTAAATTSTTRSTWPRYRLPYPAVPCLTGTSPSPAVHRPEPCQRERNRRLRRHGVEYLPRRPAPTSPPAVRRQTNYATYTWDFGDGSPTVSGYAPGAPVCTTPWLSPCAASAFHSYQYGGTYTVTLTVTDVGGHTTSATQPGHSGRSGTARITGLGRLRGLELGRARAAARAAPRTGSTTGTPPRGRGRPDAGPGHHVFGPVTVAGRCPEERPGRALLGQRAGRRTLRGSAGRVDRPPSRPARSRRDRTSAGHGPADRDRQSDPRNDQGRAQHGEDPAAQEHGNAPAQAAQGFADGEARGAQRMPRAR